MKSTCSSVQGSVYDFDWGMDMGCMNGDSRSQSPSNRYRETGFLFLCTTQQLGTTTMANLDRHVAALLDAAPHSSLDDEDDLIAQLEDEENDSAMTAFREQRIQQLHNELSRAKDQRTEGYGSYDEVKDEKELMDLTTTCTYAVVHFAKDDFARCGVMDGHLRVRRSHAFNSNI